MTGQKYPGPRYRHLGKYSAEEFRDDILIPAINSAKLNNEKLIIDLDGTLGYACSFLDEAFIGIIHKNILTKEESIKLISFKSSRLYLHDEIHILLNEEEIRKSLKIV